MLLFHRHADLPLYEQIPSNVQYPELKRFIQKIVEDVINIPQMLDFSGVTGSPEMHPMAYFDPKKYEQLLATAVLNKVIFFPIHIDIN